MSSQAMLHKIKWNNHKEIIEEQQYLFDNSLDCDCILISAQGKRFEAHQVVLSSSSDFFHKILSELPPLAEKPIIHMPDVETRVLESILKFVYTGETNCGSAYLTSLLEFCNILNIKGCVANGFTLNGADLKKDNDENRIESDELNKHIKKSAESWSSDEYLLITQTESGNCEDDGVANSESEYLEEYLDDECMLEIKDELVDDNEIDENRNESTGEFIAYEIGASADDFEASTSKSTRGESTDQKCTFRPGARSSNSQIDKALNEVNNGKTIHRLSVEYNLPRSTLYHRFRNNEHLKQNYRLERKSALDSAVRAVLNERLSLKNAADRYKIPKTAIWREVRKCEQYQPSNKEVTFERQNAQLEILSGKSLTSISAKYGIPLTTLHRDKKKLSVEGKLPESFRVKDRTENSEYGQRLEMALKKCHGGMSQYQAAKLYNIPKATMWRYANALNKSNRKSKTKQEDQHIDT